VYTFTLTDRFLNREEQDVFAEYIHDLSLDEGIWDVFDSRFKSAVSRTRPLLLRVFEMWEGIV
jgi:hypothetical protein